MRLQRLRLEFRMELASDKERVLGDLDHLDVGSVGRRAGNAQAPAGEHSFVLAVEFVTMTMALADLEVAVDALRQSFGLDLARPSAQAHGAAEFVDAAQLAQL